MINILNPIITEKSMRHASIGRFTFMVSPNATKSQVKHDVESLFKVKVVSLNISLRHVPAHLAPSRKSMVKSSLQKIATVKLAPGQTISLFDFKNEA